ncbi:MAG TPA: cell division control protein Cdc6, partial [Acidilobales archaeon]|nr:cell division control protein Cdc6 [Acidilobales archaeon]
VAPLTSRRISDIVNELDMLGLVTAKIVNRGRYGRTKIVKLNVQHRFLEDVIAEEQRLRDVIKR